MGFSFVRITALTVSCQRLWMGTGNGVIISVPLTTNASGQPSTSEADTDEASGTPTDKAQSGAVPYCSMAHAQLSFHGHRDAVKFFVAVPGKLISTHQSHI